MRAAGKRPAEFLSTHPASETRIENLVTEWQKTLPLYNQALAEGRRPDCGGASPRYVKEEDGQEEPGNEEQQEPEKEGT